MRLSLSLMQAIRRKIESLKGAISVATIPVVPEPQHESFLQRINPLHHQEEKPMATTPVVPAVDPRFDAPVSGKQTFLQHLGADIKDVFAWLGSSKGQGVIATGEALVEAAVPQAAGLINIANAWMTEIIKDETLAAQAGAQNGTGTQKAAMVLNTVTPQVVAFFERRKLAAPTATQLQAANTALVAFLNAFDAEKSA